MGPIETIALVMGAGWASGINLYAAVATLGLLGVTGNIELPTNLEILQDPMVVGAALLMYCVEFFADKVPGVDSGWDAIHSFIRIPAGAVLAAAAVGELSPAAELAAGLVGGGLAAGAHATKAGTRAFLNLSPEPVTNWTASLAEDAMVIGGVWAALNQPWIFLAFLALFIGASIWALPRIVRGLRAVFRRIFGSRDSDASQPSEPA